MSFYSELKRRNVFRVAAAYAVGGWVLIQIGDAFFPALNLPEWTTRLVAGLVVLGFPVALIFAWAFEVTPDGVKRESEADHDSSAARASAHKLDIATLVGVVLVAVIFAYQQFIASPPVPGSTPGLATATQGVTAETVDGDVAPSIAVLAFNNMSPDPDNAYFAEGISEEILNVLAGVEGLRVASRTSAFSFAGTDTPITEIAAQLDVANVLEGSVRKQGMRVRITAQLIDARTDTHLWSDTYDRDLDDIFAVQEEIANAITDAMRDALGVQSVSVDAPTDDLAAYELFLHGRQLFFERNEALNTAIESLQAAVERDPEFAEAWAYLAAAALVAPGYDTDYDRERALPIATEAAARALALDPDNAQAIAVQANLLEEDGEILDSIRGYRHAIELAPNDSSAVMWLAGTLDGFGYLAEATELAERAYQLDPLVGIVNGTLGIMYRHQGRDELAAPRLRKAEQLGWGGHILMEIQYRVAQGDVAGAEALFTEVAGPPTDEEDRQGRSLLFAALRDPAQIPALYARFDEIDARDGPRGRALASGALQDRDRYFTGLAWAMQESPEWRFLARGFWLPNYRWIVEDPRFLDLMLQQPGTAALWAEKGDPDGCVRVLGTDGEHFDCSERFGGPPE
jgi:TolB-like protein/Flp pilus assembly protein TadD